MDAHTTALLTCWAEALERDQVHVTAHVAEGVWTVRILDAANDEAMALDFSQATGQPVGAV